MPNRLANANSPYLLQHADNPVDWWEWSDEAFDAARERDVPVFLSVGYSSCHWCHVMAHESFEDEATAALLNAHFVSIKVDREVRPDVDAIYMTATQALAGQGGWPMSVWLDHDRRPFHAGTYFPPEPAHGRPSFRQLLTALSDAWESRRDEVEESAGEVLAALQSHDRNVAASGPDDAGVDQDMLAAAVALVVDRAWDRDLGGFGRAPKFPQAMLVSFLLDQHVVTGDPDALAAATSSLTAMARGGIHDHLVGGFARYSTDARWLVPHFEKMLYDNGLLLDAFATAAAITGDPELARAATGIATWLVDEMQADDGGFWAALDADTEAGEGATTVWSAAELRAVVAEVDADPDLVLAWFNVTAEGNFRPERGEPTGDNILHTTTSMAEFVAAHDLDDHDWQRQLAVATDALATRRRSRPQPGLDDKVIVSWNALAIRGLARAAGLLERPDWAVAALDAAMFIRDHMCDDDGALLHVHRAGTSWVPAFLDDVAGLALAVLELAPVVGRADLLAWGVALVEDAISGFGDGAGGFTTTRSDGERLIMAPRDAWDNAQPAGTSLLAQAAARSALLTGRREHASVARHLVDVRADQVAANPTGFGELLRAARFQLAEQREVAIVGPRDPDRAALVATVLGRPRPGTVVAVDDDVAHGPAVALLAGRDSDDGRPRAWVCRDFACQLPVTDAAALATQLGDDPEPDHGAGAGMSKD